MTDYLEQISLQLARTLIPMTIVVGGVGNLINIIVLSRATLNKHPCSHYFLMLSINGLAYSMIYLTLRLLADGYQIDPTRSSSIACKSITYITQLCFPMAPYFIVLASFDRYCASSSSVRIRQWSNTRFARRAIALVVIAFTLFYINTPIIVDLKVEDGQGCRNRGDTIYKQFYAVAQGFIFVILAPILMICFGLLTIHNTKKVCDVQNRTSGHRRTERQLLIMLLLQVSTHVILTSPMAVIYTMLVLPTQYKATRLVYFIYTIVFLIYHMSYASPFPLYFLSAKIYRQESIRLMRNFFGLREMQRVAPVMSTSHTVPMTILVQN